MIWVVQNTKKQELIDRLSEIIDGYMCVKQLVDGTESGGIAPQVIYSEIVSVKEENGKIILTNRFTYSETCGLSDVIYHVESEGKYNEDVFEYLDGKLTRNGRQLFDADYPWFKESLSMIQEFYKQISDIVTDDWNHKIYAA